MGRTACELLLERLAGERSEPRRILLPHTLAVRQSVAPLVGVTS
jgi:DNA-binding LacI/PurR family transcriptional regulator